MLSILKFVLDPYDRRARLQPALLSALSLFVSLLLLVPQFPAVWSVVSGVVLFCGVTTWLMHLGRGRGKAREPQLFQAWGGKPSVAMLRHGDRRLSSSDKGRYRAFLERSVPGLKLASPRQEQRSREQADDGYQGATTWLLAQTRDRSKFELLFRENMNYGFRRNLWALRGWALTFDVAAIAIVALAKPGLLAQFSGGTPPADTTILVSAAIVVVHAVTFLIVIRADWVREVADAYARQLLAACDRLSKGPPPSTAT